MRSHTAATPTDGDAGRRMADLLSELFSSKVRAAVLGCVLPRPHLAFSLTDLARRLDLPISSLQHECYKLARIGVLKDARDGGSRRYRPDPACPLLAPLTALVTAAIGDEAALAAAVEGVAGLDAAFLAGALPPAAAAEPPRLVLIGELAVEEVDAALVRVVAVLAPALGCERVEVAFYRPADWRRRCADGNRYVADLLGSQRLPLVGRLDP